jgi:hypothetical protein
MDYKIEMNLRETGWGVDWIHVAKDRDRWRVLLNKVISFVLHTILGASYKAEELLVSQQGP